MTVDCDILLKPEPTNGMNAVKVMKKLGFVLTNQKDQLGAQQRRLSVK